MNAILVAVILLLFGILLWQRQKERKLLENLSEMLEEAIRGTYTEEDYDESLLSSVEAKLARFLGRSVLSERRVSKERDQVKALISDISHQTKTPLSNIILYTELLEELPLSKEAGEAALALKGQAEKLNFLIGALVKMSRLENGIITVNPQKNSIKSLIDGVLEEISLKREIKEISLEVSVEEDFFALFDWKWTAEALYNLVDNAVKYTPKGGRVSLRTTAFYMFCRIEVADTGIGIAEAEQSRIFQRFYRGREAKETEGAGLGLFLAREILSAQRGYIRVASKKGEGAVFAMYLPMD